MNFYVFAIILQSGLINYGRFYIVAPARARRTAPSCRRHRAPLLFVRMTTLPTNEFVLVTVVGFRLQSFSVAKHSRTRHSVERITFTARNFFSFFVTRTALVFLVQIVLGFVWLFVLPSTSDCDQQPNKKSQKVCTRN